MKRLLSIIIIHLLLLSPIMAQQKQPLSPIQEAAQAEIEKRYGKYPKLNGNMSFWWKKKKGKYALALREEGKEDIVLTDYKYSVCKLVAKEKVYIINSSSEYLNRLSLLVECNGRFGIINLLGHEVVPCKYIAAKDDRGNIQNNSEYNYKDIHNVGGLISTISYFHVKGDNGKWGSVYYNEGYDTNITEPQFDSIYTNQLLSQHLTIEKTQEFVSNYSWNIFNVGLKYIGFRRDHYNPYTTVEKDGKFGVLAFGELIIPPLFDKASFCFQSHDLQKKGENTYTLRNGLVFDNNIKGDDNYFQYITIQRRLFYLLKDGKKVWYDTKTGNIIPVDNAKSEHIAMCSRNMYYQYYNGKGWGYMIDNGGSIPPHYGEDIDNFSPIPCIATDIFIVKNVKDENLIGLYNAKLKKELLPPVYTKIMKTDLRDGFFLVEKDSTDCSYAYITCTRDSVVLLKNKKDAYAGAEFIPIDSTLSLVKKDGGYGITDSESGLIVPCVYDSIKPVEYINDKISEDLRGRLFVSYFDKEWKGLISRDAVVANPYFPYIGVYLKSISLWDNGQYHSEDLSISIKDSIINITNDWEADLKEVLKEDFDNYFESLYKTAVMTDNRTLLEATINARLQNLENRMWAKAEKGKSFVEEFDKMRSLCYFAWINLDYKQMEDYSKTLKSTYENLYAIYSDKQQQIQAQKEEEERQRQEEERQRQEQLRQQRIAAEQARQQRLQAWADVAAAVANGMAHVNASVNASHTRKQHHYNHSTPARNYTQTTTSKAEPNYVRCDHCGGSGTCTRVNTNITLFKSHCRGTGKCQHCIDGLVTTSFGTRVCTYCKGTAKCYHCKGTGKCSKCHGTGKIKK